MKRSTWKALLIISIILAILLFMFTVFIWALSGATGALLFGLLNGGDMPDTSHYTYGYFMQNFVGSPMFWVSLADVALMITSIVMLIIKRKK